MRFDLTDLRLFLAVADAGSITHGAAEAGLSLPAASERLREMERSGRVSLLARGRRGVTLTEAGEALAHHARLVLQQMALLRGELGAHAKGVRATVRVLANTAAITEFLPERLGPWMAAHPQADIELNERQSVEIARSLTAGFAEIGILSDAAETGALSLRPFATDRLVVVSAPGQMLDRGGEIGFAELLDRHFIGLAGGALQDHLEARAAQIGSRLRMRVKLRSFSAICRMAAAGAGIGIVPETAARRSAVLSPIEIVRLADAWATRRLVLAVRDEAALTPLARSLFAHLGAAASEGTSPGEQPRRNASPAPQ